MKTINKMKTLLTLILVAGCLQVQAQQPYLNERALHISYSALITTTVTGYLHYHGMEKQKAVKYAALIGLGAGILKESLDKQWSNEDIANNFVGVAGATIVFTLPIKRKGKKR